MSLLSVAAWQPTNRVDLGGGREVLVYDNFLSQPDQVRAYGQARMPEFVHNKANKFPGIEYVLPDDCVSGVRDWVRNHLIKQFAVMRGGLSLLARMSLVSMPPEQLAWGQRFCHRDSVNADPAKRLLAGVLYLFDDPLLGGTSFFDLHDESAFREMNMLYRGRRYAELMSRYPGFFESPAYMTGDNRFFSLLATVPPAFNRAIFYDGSIYHSGDIRAPSRLAGTYEAGRATVNFFIEGLRSA